MSPTELAQAAETRQQDSWYEWPQRVDWAFYSALLRRRGEARIPRMVYLDGSLAFMTPSIDHEERKERINRFVNEVAAGCRIPYRPTASTTWRRRKRRGGVEGDHTYFIKNEPKVRGKSTLDLRTDPPPDLAVEVVYSHDVSRALEVYRRLGVPEVWVATEQRFVILILDRPGRGRKYLESNRSVGFPFLSVEEIHNWIFRDNSEGELQWSLDLRDWVREPLAPRASEGQGA